MVILSQRTTLAGFFEDRFFGGFDFGWKARFFLRWASASVEVVSPVHIRAAGEKQEDGSIKEVVRLGFHVRIVANVRQIGMAFEWRGAPGKKVAGERCLTILGERQPEQIVIACALAL